MAQLGARLHGMEEVEGSNPFRSTNFTLARALHRDPASPRNTSVSGPWPIKTPRERIDTTLLWV